jgi:kynurenine formamidase
VTDQRQDRSPRYADLPVAPGAPPGSSWGLWSDRPGGDLLGCLNRLTPERVRAAAAGIRTGRVFPLDLPLDLIDPPLFGRARFRHEVTGPLGGPGHDDLLHDLNTQSSTQWDGFRHISHPEHGFYGGVADEDHGIDHWARHGIAGRAVVADVGRWREAQGRPLRLDEPDPIAPDEVLACVADQGTEVREGDVLLLRTGWLGWYRTLDQQGRTEVAASLACPGLAPGEATAAMLWDLGLAAVAADNPALEVWPLAGRDRTPEVFVHTSLLPLLGLPIGELWDLDALAQDCAAAGTHDCFLTSAPLRVPGGVGSPPGATAIR